MNNKKSFFVFIFLSLGDIFSLILLFSFFFYLKFGFSIFFSTLPVYSYILSMIPLLVIFFVFFIDLYKDVLARPYFEEFKYSIYLSLLCFLITVVFLYITKTGEKISREVILLSFASNIIFSVIIRNLLKLLLKKYFVRTNQESILNAIIICKYNEIENVFSKVVYNSSNRYSILGVCPIGGKAVDIGLSIINMDDMLDFALKKSISSVLIFIDPHDLDYSIIQAMINLGIEVSLCTTTIFGYKSEFVSILKTEFYSYLNFRSFSFSRKQILYLPIKRFLDILFSIIGCIFLIFIIPLIKLLYIFNGDFSSVIFKQERIGKNGKRFNLLKFRSMRPDSAEILENMLKNDKFRSEWDKNQKITNDPRITKIGEILRKTSIDEFPQFVNVLKGDMSFIGPRPLVYGELSKHNGNLLYEKVKPGITGWWACNGRSNLSYEERLDLEYYYVRNFSLYLDFVCVLRSISTVIFHKGAK